MSEVSTNSYQQGLATTPLGGGIGETTVSEDAAYKPALQALLAAIYKTYPFEQPPVGTPVLAASQADREPDFFTPESGQRGLPQPLSAGREEPTLGAAGLAVVAKVGLAVVRQAVANAEPGENSEAVNLNGLDNDPDNTLLPAPAEETSVEEINLSLYGPGSSSLAPYSVGSLLVGR